MYLLGWTRDDPMSRPHYMHLERTDSNDQFMGGFEKQRKHRNYDEQYDQVPLNSRDKRRMHIDGRNFGDDRYSLYY